MKKGFTLIELLVVILILGILAAVALPQYQKAVLKSRFSNFRTAATTYARAAEVYYLSNGDYPDDFSVLDVSFPSGEELIENSATKSSCGINEKMYCCVVGFSPGNFDASVYCGERDYSLIYRFVMLNNKSQCYANNDLTKQVCKSMGGTNEAEGVANIPGGTASGYTRWYIP